MGPGVTNNCTETGKKTSYRLGNTCSCGTSLGAGDVALDLSQFNGCLPPVAGKAPLKQGQDFFRLDGGLTSVKYESRLGRRVPS